MLKNSYPWYTLFSLFFLFHLTLSQPANYTDNPITLTREFLVFNQSDSIDPLQFAIWGTSNIYAWSSGPLYSASVYVISNAELETDDLNPVVISPSGAFADSTDISISCGSYDQENDQLFFFGFNKLYRLSQLDSSDGLRLAQNEFEFPSRVLPGISFIHNGDVFGLQSGNDYTLFEVLPPKLYQVEISLYDVGYNESLSTTIYNFSSILTQTYDIDETNGLIILGSRVGLLEIRSYPGFAYRSLIEFPNMTMDGDPWNIKYLTVDESRKLLYFCGDIERQVVITRINLTDNGISLDGLSFNDLNNTDLSTVYTLVFEYPGYGCTGLVIDPEIGVGYISVADSSDVGFLLKFDIKRMQFLSNLIMPITRDSTRINWMKIDTTKKIIYTLLQNSIAVYRDYTTSCSNDCNFPNGNCVYSTCNCTSQWIGTDCSEAACLQGCNEQLGGGVCHNGQCYCYSDWTGLTCSERRCPDDCLSKGVCGGPSTNYTCICNEFNTGRNCAKEKFTTCESINGDPKVRDYCLKYGKDCGFCLDDKTCKTGGRTGPIQGSCKLWLYDGDLDTFPQIVAIIIIVCWIIMFIINSISAIIEDWKIADSLQRDSHAGSTKAQLRAWWRDERSAKSWKLWDQIQFLALYTVTNMTYSTRLINLTSFFNWTAFLIPLTPFHDDTVHTGRSLNSYQEVSSVDQTANSIGVAAQNIFWVCIIWWLIALAVTLALFGLYYLIAIKILKKGETYSTIFVHRLFHLLCRISLAGYLPICCLAGWAIIDPSHRNGLLVIPILFLLLLGIGLPIFNYLVVRGEKTDFLFYSTRIRYGSLYVQFKREKVLFIFFVYARKIILAVFFGFLIPQNYEDLSDVNLFYAQIILPAVLMLAYIIGLVVIKPYVDFMHMILDSFLNFLNILTLGVAILFRNSDVSQRNVGLLAVMILQITGLISVILAYLYTWMFYAGYNSVSELCGHKPEENKDLVSDDKPAADDSHHHAEKSKGKASEKSDEVEMKETHNDAKSEGEKKPKKKKKAEGEKKESTPKEINEENLGNLSISDD